jgi:RNA polymerase sigma-B factor
VSRRPRPPRSSARYGLAHPDVDALFRELRASGAPDARTALIEAHLPLARGLAARYRHLPQPLEDLEQVASLALVKAVDAFEPERGAPFAAYAVPTILGELKRHMRDATWDVHVPRALKERVLAIEAAERALSARTGSAPTVEALAAEAGVSSEQVLEALGARLAHDAVPLATPEASQPERESAAVVPAIADDFRDSIDERLVLSEALRALPRRERTILRLRLLDGLTQTEIAERVGLSQMYVSRLLRATLERLRDEIE